MILSPSAARAVIAATLWLLAGPAAAQTAGARSGAESLASAAVVMSYARFGEPSSPATSIRLDQFETHLRELREGGYTVLPLADIVAALHDARPLPDRTIAIVIDDASAALHAEAWPRLRQASLPFTVFVATDAIDRAAPGSMTWDQLRELAASGLATIASQSASHPRMAFADAARVADELARSRDRIAAEIGVAPTLFAYPYGEASAATKALVREAGYLAAFGQHSGVAHAGDDFWYLPRFGLSEKFGGELSQFRTRARALPLPVGDVVPADPLLSGANPPAFGFTVLERLTGLDRLSCFHTEQGRLATERLGEGRIEVRLSAPLPAGRARINCTMPAGDRWRWYGTQFLVPPGGGR